MLADTGHCHPLHSEECPEVFGCAGLAVVAPSHKGRLQRRLLKISFLLEGKVFGCLFNFIVCFVTGHSASQRSQNRGTAQTARRWSGNSQVSFTYDFYLFS